MGAEIATVMIKLYDFCLNCLLIRTADFVAFVMTIRMGSLCTEQLPK